MTRPVSVAFAAWLLVSLAVTLISCKGTEEDTSRIATAAPSPSAAPASATAASSPTPLDPTPSATLAPTVKYTNPVHGYTLEYPSDWFAHTDPGGYLILTGYDPATAKGIGGFPNTAKIDIGVFEIPSGQKLSEWLAESDATDAEYFPGSLRVGSETNVSTPAPGIERKLIIDNIEMRDYAFESGSRFFRIFGGSGDSPNGSAFDLVLRSFTLPEAH